MNMPPLTYFFQVGSCHIVSRTFQNYAISQVHNIQYVDLWNLFTLKQYLAFISLLSVMYVKKHRFNECYTKSLTLNYIPSYIKYILMNNNSQKPVSNDTFSLQLGSQKGRVLVLSKIPLRGRVTCHPQHSIVHKWFFSHMVFQWQDTQKELFRERPGLVSYLKGDIECSPLLMVAVYPFLPSVQKKVVRSGGLKVTVLETLSISLAFP